MKKETGWPPCIVTMFDMVGTKSKSKNGVASSLMRKMHGFAIRAINNDLPYHDHGYVWNDSVLLLSHKTTASDRQHVIQELIDFKSNMEKFCGQKFYAICVKGKTFPNHNIEKNGRAIFLRTSSWAMANCFEIEKCFNKKHKMDWYLDSWITNGIVLNNPDAIDHVRLLPNNEERAIHLYKRAPLLNFQSSRFHQEFIPFPK